jgi:hypothetical protein
MTHLEYPSETVADFVESPRGCGFHFGEAPLLAFLERCGAMTLSGRTSSSRRDA